MAASCHRAAPGVKDSHLRISPVVPRGGDRIWQSTALVRRGIAAAGVCHHIRLEPLRPAIIVIASPAA